MTKPARKSNMPPVEEPDLETRDDSPHSDAASGVNAHVAFPINAAVETSLFPDPATVRRRGKTDLDDSS